MSISISFNAVFPIVVYITLGILAKKLNYLDETLTKRMNSFVFQFFFPCLMLNNILTAKDTITDSLIGPLFLICVTLVLTIISIIIAKFVYKDYKKRGAFVQAITRGNFAIFAVPVVTQLCGEANTGFAAVCVAFLSPFTNALAVVILEKYRGEKIKPLKIFLNVLKNPVVWSSILGFIIVLSGIPVASFVRTPIRAMSNALTPIALMILGADLKFTGIKKDFKDLIFVSIVKLLLVPILIYTIAKYLGFSGYELVSLLVIGAVPTAVSTYPLAQKLDSDVAFTGEIIAITSVLSVFTVFMWLVTLSF